MKLLLILACSLLLCAAPISAQPDIGDTAGDVLEAATESAQSLGVAAFVAVVVAVIVLVIVIGSIIAVLIFAYKGGFRPVYDLVVQANKRADEEREAREASEKKLTEYRERQAQAAVVQAEAAERQAAASERLAERMAKTETTEEAQAGRKGAVQQINQHTDEAHAETQRAVQRMLDRAIEQLGSVQAKNEQRAGEEHGTADLTIPQVQATLIEAKEHVKKLGDTGELSPTDPTPPASDS